MACGCRGGSKVASQQSGILGFDYTFDGTTTRFMTIIEARTQQRRNGGGTIKTVRAAA